MNQRRHLIPVLDRLASVVVACAGDIMLDRFVHGAVERISPEAPIPVIHIQHEQSWLGGLGNAVRNLSALGCSVRMFSVTGDDATGAEVEHLVRDVPRCEAFLIRERMRSTPLKIRYIAHSQQLLRADRESVEPAAPEVFQALRKQFEARVAECSIVLLSDYAKGVLDGSHAQQLIQAARAAGKPVVVDPKGRDFTRYRHATLIKPNLKELAEATGMPVGDTRAQEAAARRLLEQTEARFILVTRGSAGMLLVGGGSEAVEFTAAAREVYDVSGAGDTVAAALTAALGAGAGIEDAAELANLAAGIVVGKIGTAVVDRAELIRDIEGDAGSAAAAKILEQAEVLEQDRAFRRTGGRTGFAYGAFHPLTPEHLALLERTRAQCDRLVVGLAAGPGEAPARALLLASLMHVDTVVVCNGEFPHQLVEALRPAVMVQAGDTDQDGPKPRR